MNNSAFSVANKFIELADSNQISISPLKLLKLVYIAHGWHLAVFDKPLLDEPIEAWQYGPVVRTLYHEFKRFGRDAITEPAQILVNDQLVPVPIPTDPDAIALIEKVWEAYGGLSAYQLANLTHQANTPWDKVRKKWSGHGALIPDKIIKKHYVEKKAA